jgi:hypothetical protein
MGKEAYFKEFNLLRRYLSEWGYNGYYTVFNSGNEHCQLKVYFGYFPALDKFVGLSVIIEKSFSSPSSPFYGTLEFSVLSGDKSSSTSRPYTTWDDNPFYFDVGRRKTAAEIMQLILYIDVLCKQEQNPKQYKFPAND